MRFHCPAKINLFLEVLGCRTDGYHRIRTLFQTVEFSDFLDVTLNGASGLALEVIGDRGEVPAGEKNLVYQAYLAWQRICGPAPGVNARLSKKIPAGAGLGGGSSDAAAMLLFLQQQTGRPDEKSLSRLASGLGSDVPFFLHGGTALGCGRGNLIRPLTDASKQLVLLVLPPKPMSSSQVYRQFTPLLTRESKRISIHRYLGEGGEVCLQRGLQRNDLESVVFKMYPLLGRLKDLLYDTGAGFASLSGSGSGLFGLYRSDAVAAEAADVFQRLDCKTVLTGFLGRQQYRALQGVMVG